MRKSYERIAQAAIVICALVPRPDASAQVATAGPRTAWTVATNYLGIENFSCNCTMSFGSATTPRQFEFRSEPIVLGVMRRGPSFGLLERGDAITHIDGVSILTAEGGRRFASITPGDDVNLTIRRNGRTMKVSLRASEASGLMYTPAPVAGYAIGWDDGVVAPTPAVPAAPSRRPGYTPRAPRAPEAVQPGLPAEPAWPGVAATAITPGVWVGTPAVAPISMLPRGWYGFSVRCNGCGWSSERSDDRPTWESADIPEVAMVDPQSPAARAGIRTGDRITHIDGVSITSSEGARRFGSPDPGQKVRLTIRRGKSTLHRDLVVGTRPEVRAAIAAGRPATPSTPAPPSMRRQLRYSGKLDNVSVEVWSAGGPTVDKFGDTMVITVGASVVRIKVDPRK